MFKYCLIILLLCGILSLEVFLLVWFDVMCDVMWCGVGVIAFRCCSIGCDKANHLFYFAFLFYSTFSDIILQLVL